MYAHSGVKREMNGITGRKMFYAWRRRNPRSFERVKKDERVKKGGSK